MTPKHPSGSFFRRGLAVLVVAMLATLVPGLDSTGLTTSSASGSSVEGRALKRADPPQRAAAVGLLGRKRHGAAVKAKRAVPIETGMRFRAKSSGRAIGLAFYKSWRRSAATPRRGTLWTKSTVGWSRLASARFEEKTGRGWVRITFTESVPLQPGRVYLVSVYSPRGHYSADLHDFSAPKESAHLKAPARRNGVFDLGRGVPTTPSPRRANYLVDVRFVPDQPTTTTPPPNSTWPGPANTGVPSDVTVAPYRGPCTITSTTTISGVDATDCGALLIDAPGVVISNSLLPRIDATQGGGATVTINDSNVDGADWVDGAVWGNNITLQRVEVTGGQHSVHCGSDCSVTDSWLHAQYNPDGEGFHNNAFLSNGGRNMVLRHNTLHCDTLLNNTDGGCTGDLTLLGDFEPISNVTIDNNLLKANASSISYCLYAGYASAKPYPVATGIVVTNNVFERGTNRKCGVYGPVTGYQGSASGNSWSGNVWDDGGAVRADAG